MSLYDPKLERDNCGFGLLAHMEGEASHKLVRLAMSALARMQHRGGISADGKTGDGCGLLLQKPDSFFRAVAEEKGWHLGRNYAVGMLFLNPDPILAQATRDIIDEELERETLSLVGWRKVPIDTNVLGSIAKASLPSIEQVFVNAPPGWVDKDLERRLYIVRRRIEKRGNPNDQWKLEHWDEYIAGCNFEIPENLKRPGAKDSLIIFRNNNEKEFEHSMKKCVSILDQTMKEDSLQQVG